MLLLPKGMALLTSFITQKDATDWGISQQNNTEISEGRIFTRVKLICVLTKDLVERVKVGSK